MKATVWTKTDYDDPKAPRSKCIWAGEIHAIPNKDTGIVIRDGFCVEYIEHVYYSLHNNTVEIQLKTTDPNNEYGVVNYKLP